MTSSNDSLRNEPIPWDIFHEMRENNLSRWPTGAGVDLDAAVECHQRLPKQKRMAQVIRFAYEHHRTLTQPRGGFGTLGMHLELLRTLQDEGLADLLPTTTDSYTRNERFGEAERGMQESEQAGRSMLNGLPVVNLGVTECAKIVDSVDRPLIVLSGTTMPRLTAEITLAAGFSGYLGSGIAYTASYTKDTSIEQGIRNYQYLDRLVTLYGQRGVEIHRRQPSFLTGTLIPPAIAIAVAILDCLLAVTQGVTHYGLELGQCLCPVQDVAAIRACEELCQEYLTMFGFHNIFTPITSLHWMGAWPHDEAQAMALIVYGGFIAAAAGAVSVTTKSTHEAIGIPTKEANAAGLRATKAGIQLGASLALQGLRDVVDEIDLIKREVRDIVDKTLEMGDGDVCQGVLRACRAGVLDVPWSPNREIQSRVLPARELGGAIRMLDFGNVPIRREIQQFHQEQLQKTCNGHGHSVEYRHGNSRCLWHIGTTNCITKYIN